VRKRKKSILVIDSLSAFLVVLGSREKVAMKRGIAKDQGGYTLCLSLVVSSGKGCPRPGMLLDDVCQY
jgi:hypothetical protein